MSMTGSGRAASESLNVHCSTLIIAYFGALQLVQFGDEQVLTRIKITADCSAVKVLLLKIECLYI